jgi:hypothetical protein
MSILTLEIDDELFARARQLAATRKMTVPEMLERLLRAAVDLAERGVDQKQAADQRQRLATFAEDWQRPEMDSYDAL